MATKRAAASPVRRDRARTMEKLIDAGTVVFSRRGYDGASVKEISEVSGVNASLINRYFDGKEGLLLAIVDRFIAHKQSGVLGYPPQPTLVDELRAYLRYRLQEDAEHEALIRILVSRVAIDEPFRRRVFRSMTGRSDRNLRERLECLQARRQIPGTVDLDELFTAVSWFSFSTNFLGHLITGRPRAELEGMIDVFAETYAAGLERRAAKGCRR